MIKNSKAMPPEKVTSGISDPVACESRLRRLEVTESGSCWGFWVFLEGNGLPGQPWASINDQFMFSEEGASGCLWAGKEQNWSRKNRNWPKQQGKRVVFRVSKKELGSVNTLPLGSGTHVTLIIHKSIKLCCFKPLGFDNRRKHQ